ncbi:MAG: SGNH/GDSL hydrolase family protein [Thermodesulfovibrionales bacterium]
MAAAMKSLVFLGDSLTEWFDWQTRFPQDRVINLGRAGEPVEGLLGRLDRICTHVAAPDFCFLMTGINNIAMDDSDILGNYLRIVRTLRERWAGSALVVQSLLPVLLDWVGPEPVIKVNRGLKTLAEETGAAYLDVYRSFVDSSGRPDASLLLDDGVHLSAQGYAVWAGVVEGYLGRNG